MDTNKALSNHLNNLSVVNGSGADRYSYILNQNDLINTYMQMRNDLNYPLAIDSKYRRAIIYNKEGLEERILNTILNTIYNNLQTITDMVIDNSLDKIVYQLNNITQNNNGIITLPKSSSINTNNNLNKFAKLLAKELVDEVSNIIKDTSK